MKLVFVHGWATDSWVWEEITHEYNKYGSGAVTVNLPGHGGKLKWDSPTLDPGENEVGYRIEALGEPVIGIGWSLGAQALLKTALAIPNRFMGLVLVGATPSFVTREGFPFGQSPALVKKMASEMKQNPGGAAERFYKLNFTPGEMESPRVKEFLDRYKYPGPVDCAEVKEGMPPGCRPLFDYEQITNALESLAATDLRGELEKIEIPTLVVHGEKDEVCPPEAGAFLAEKLKNSEHQVMEDAGHAPFVVDPHEFRFRMEEFMKAI